jgi:MFS superfamily sulfate permease-like transporter
LSPPETVQRVLPITAWLPAYERDWLRADVLAGLTVWAILVPQALAYAELAGMPAVTGLYAAFGAMLVYPLFGS